MEKKMIELRKGLFGGNKVCKNCGQKKSLLSTAVCSGTTRPHVWVNAQQQ